MEKTIYYDLTKAIKMSNENKNLLTILKNVYRENPAGNIIIAGTIAGRFFIKPPKEAFMEGLILTGTYGVIALAASLIGPKARYKKVGNRRVEDLSEYFKSKRIDIDSDDLKKATLERKETSIRLEKGSFPKLVVSKHILVPLENQNKNVYLLQEHVVGSGDYVLTKKPNIK